MPAADRSASRTYAGRLRGRRGYSLIEVMVTVAIVAIIASIAYPSYRAYVLRSNRTDAIRSLTEDAQILQRCYSQTYTFVGCAPVPPACPAVTTSPNGFYNVCSTIAALPVQIFTLKAVPIGSQTSDTTCAQFTLDQTGQELAQDSSATDQSTTCWGSN